MKSQISPYNLFLDDFRLPQQVHGEDKEWVLVVNYEQFVSTIKQKGLPQCISFDHDLCEEHMALYFQARRTNGKFDYSATKIPTGLHCIKWLKQEGYDLSKVKIYIHTANEYGRANMLQELTGAIIVY